MRHFVRILLVAALVGNVGMPSIALADPWRATAALEPDSPAVCRQADVSKLVFDFTQADSKLLGKTSDGHAFTVPVAIDGTISTTIKLPVGAKEFLVDLTGNVMSHELQVFNKEHSCRFKLSPMSIAEPTVLRGK